MLHFKKHSTQCFAICFTFCTIFILLQVDVGLGITPSDTKSTSFIDKSMTEKTKIETTSICSSKTSVMGDLNTCGDGDSKQGSNYFTVVSASSENNAETQHIEQISQALVSTCYNVQMEDESVSDNLRKTTASGKAADKLNTIWINESSMKMLKESQVKFKILGGISCYSLGINQVISFDEKQPENRNSDGSQTLELDTGVIDYEIPDKGWMYYGIRRENGVPDGAKTTDLKYTLKIYNKDVPKDIYCKDYEVYLSSTSRGGGVPHYLVYDNLGTRTDGNYDDDTSNDYDIFLSSRSTSHFNGEDPNQFWFVYIKDTTSGDYGHLRYIIWKVYWKVSDPPCPNCYGDRTIIENRTFDSSYNGCECGGTVSLTTEGNVTIKSGATVAFTSPKITLKPGFHAEKGATFTMKSETPTPITTTTTLSTTSTTTITTTSTTSATSTTLPVNYFIGTWNGAMKTKWESGRIVVSSTVHYWKFYSNGTWKYSAQFKLWGSGASTSYWDRVVEGEYYVQGNRAIDKNGQFSLELSTSNNRKMDRGWWKGCPCLGLSFHISTYEGYESVYFYLDKN